MPESFEESMRGQFPLRPHHPDFDRMREVVQQVEEWKAEGVKPEVAYARLVDVYSMSYLGVNRAGLIVRDGKRPRDQVERMDELANSWCEGFMFGVLFQQYGGHRGGEGEE